MILFNNSWNHIHVSVEYNINTGHVGVYTSYANQEKSRINGKKHLKKRRKIMNHLKENGCAICGYNDCVDALDFHHTNPKDREFNVKVGSLNKNEELIVNELNKCILLCSNCHREIHSKEGWCYGARKGM